MCSGLVLLRAGWLASEGGTAALVHCSSLESHFEIKQTKTDLTQSTAVRKIHKGVNRET